MGISKSAAMVLFREGQRRALGGSLLTLGKQDVHFSHNVLKKLAKRFNQPLVPLSEVHLSLKHFLKNRGYISDQSFFKSLGFSEVKSLDASEYENADIIFDLNQDKIPKSLEESFDVIIDSGTLEHVFHLPNALSNIFKLLKLNGRIIHFSPSSNYMDHGFYMFSPTFFWDYYTENGFEINVLQVVKTSSLEAWDGWKLCEYTPGALYPISSGGLDNSTYGVLTIVTKRENSTSNKIPTQFFYSKQLWANNLIEKNSNKYTFLKKLIAKFPLIGTGLLFLRKILSFFKVRKLGLKVVDHF